MDTRKLPLPLLITLGLAQSTATGCRTRCSPCLRLLPPTEVGPDGDPSSDVIAPGASGEGMTRSDAIGRVLGRGVLPPDVAESLRGGEVGEADGGG